MSFGPFCGGPSNAALEKLTPVRAGVKMASKVVYFSESQENVMTISGPISGKVKNCSPGKITISLFRKMCSLLSTLLTYIFNIFY